MEPLNHKGSGSKRILLEEDVNISTFRRRNEILILVFLFIIISLTLIIGSFIISLVHVRNNTTSQPHKITAIEAFCSVSYPPSTCLRTLNPIISNRYITDPNQIFTLSLQTAAKDLEYINSSLILSNSASTDDTEKFAFKSCSNSLRDGFGQIREPLETMRANPFVESLSGEQWGEIMNRIVAAEEDIESCLENLGKIESVAVGVATAKLLDVKVYLNGAKGFLMGYARVLQIMDSGERAVDYGDVIFFFEFGICLKGLQLLFILFLYCSLFRIR